MSRANRKICEASSVHGVSKTTEGFPREHGLAATQQVPVRQFPALKKQTAGVKLGWLAR